MKSSLRVVIETKSSVSGWSSRQGAVSQGGLRMVSETKSIVVSQRQIMVGQVSVSIFFFNGKVC